MSPKNTLLNSFFFFAINSEVIQINLWTEIRQNLYFIHMHSEYSNDFSIYQLVAIISLF